MQTQAIQQLKKISAQAAVEYNAKNFSADATRQSLDKITANPKVANVMQRLSQV